MIRDNTIADTQASPTMHVGIRFVGVAADNAGTGLLFKDDVISYFGSPLITTPYISASTTSPEFHERIPNFDRSNAFYPSAVPLGSSIFDPVSARTYTNINATTANFVSQETAAAVPVSGKYRVGDRVFNQLATATGVCFWVNTVAGTPGTFTASACGAPTVVGSGTATMTTAAIASGACGTTVTVAATGVATTDTIDVANNAAVTAANGGVLIPHWWPTANNVNFNYCNPTAAGVTPSAATLNWKVTR